MLLPVCVFAPLGMILLFTGLIALKGELDLFGRTFYGWSARLLGVFMILLGLVMGYAVVVILQASSSIQR